MNALHLLAATLLPLGAAVGQCAFSTAVVSPLGAGCNPVVGTTTVPLTVSVSIPTCGIGIGTSLLTGLDKQPIARVLVLGLQAAAQPLPALGAGCVLFPSSDVVLVDPWFAPVHRLQLPAAPLPPVTVYAQGAVLYELLPANGFEWAFSAGARIDLQ